MPAPPSNPHLMAFGAAVRELRNARGFSQEHLAGAAGVHRTYMGDVERGVRNLGLLNIWRIARALEVPPSQLVTLAEDIEARTSGSGSG